ncbi:hypothetical protein OH77DRAFT_1518836 [Trametes cingulata]|nr:hypothetical protein OH77DRAFT_1518836 [Trametes cingulata]
MLHRLPVEIIERIIDLLDGDIPSLAACSLTCRGLLPICRTYIWREVTLSMLYEGQTETRTAAFFELIRADPDVASYVSTLSLCPDAYLVEEGIPAPWDRATVNDIVAPLPNLRTLRLYGFRGPELCLYELMTMTRDFPTIEELHVQDIIIDDSRDPTDTDLMSLRSTGPPGVRWALKKLAIVATGEDYIHTWVLVRLVSALELFADRVHLESLDVRTTIHRYFCTLTEWPSLVPTSAASCLRHFGVTIRDVYPTREESTVAQERIRRVLSELPQHRPLRSLCLQYDLFETFLFACHAHPDDRPPPYPPLPSPSFLDVLSDVLSAPGEPALPNLERLSLVFLCPSDWIACLHTSFQRLAAALVGTPDHARPGGVGVRRYPAFAHLEVRTVIVEAVRVLWGDEDKEEYLARQDAVKRDLILPMLAPFVRAGVDVRVVLDG